jgi:peptidyl-prolyl cis-trans isomerase SurA
MKKSVLFLVLIFQSIQLFGQGKVINKVVAQVGDNVILLSDLEVQKMQVSSEGNEMNFPKECAILEQLLIEELLLNQALLDSLEVTDQSVDAEMENRLRVIESKMGRILW